MSKTGYAELLEGPSARGGRQIGTASLSRSHSIVWLAPLLALAFITLAAWGPGVVLAQSLLAGQTTTQDLRPVISQDGTKLASAGADGLITILDLVSGRELAKLGSTQGRVGALAFSPDGQYLASAKEGAVSLWGLEPGTESSTLPTDTGRTVNRLAFSTKGGRLAALVDGSEIAIWELGGDAGRWVLSEAGEAVTDIAFSPDGSYLASFGAGPQITVWDLSSRKPHLTLSSPTAAPITGAAFSPSGNILAGADEDAAISLWDLETGRGTALSGHSDLIKRLRFSPSGDRLATEGMDGQLNVWGVEPTRETLTLYARVDTLVTGLAFSPDGTTLASVGTENDILLWSLPSGALSQVLDGHAVPVQELAFGASGQTLAGASADGKVIVWDLLSGAQRFALQVPATGRDVSGETAETKTAGQTESSAAVAAGTATNILAAPTSAEESARATDAAAKAPDNGRIAKRLSKRILALAVSVDGSKVAAASASGLVRLGVGNDDQLGEESADTLAGATGVAFSPIRKLLYSVSRDTQLRRWSSDTGQLLQSLQGHEHPTTAVAVSHNDRYVASAGEETRIMVWSETGKLVRILNNAHKDFVNALAFNPKKLELASGDNNGIVLVWNPEQQAPARALLGHAKAVNALAYSNDGRFIVSGSSDTTVKLWNSANGRQLASLKHSAPVRAVAVSPNDRYLASAGDDTRIYIWDLNAGGALVRTLNGASDMIASLTFLRSGRLLAGGEDGSIALWNVVSNQLIRTFRPPSLAAAGESVGDPIALVPARGELASSRLHRSSGFAQDFSPRGILIQLAGRLLDWLVPVAEAAVPPAPGGPILVIKSASSPFGDYYAEILRAEGFNAFSVADIATVTPEVLGNYDVAILGEMPLTAAQVSTLSVWVNAGGNLIAMRPEPDLASLLGVTASGDLSEGYLRVNTSAPPGNGIVGETMQFHGTASRLSLNGATSVATLYSDATTQTSHHAVTLHSVGNNGGQAAAFAYDLATSIVYTRQGNPAWANQERDGYAPQRSDDKYYGAAALDPQADWVDLNKVAIPQADEQQRLLTNLIIHTTRDRKPLPRFWYFPRGEKAVVLMTGDDHANNGTEGRWNDFLDASPSGCSVEDWECVRGTSYIFPNFLLSNSKAVGYEAQGFEVGVHINTSCGDYTDAELRSFYTQQFDQFAQIWPGVPRPTTQRHHCIAWTDWVTAAKVQAEYGVRLDTSYYFWPPSWALNRPGFFNGSGLAMRFADLDGTLIDVYQAATQMTDESGQQYPFTINTLLDRALGAEAYYGVFVINAHTDVAVIPESTTTVASAKARGVPIITSRQLLKWLDGRDSSAFTGIAWNGTTLSFGVTAGAGSNGLQALVPLSSEAGVVNGVKRDGTGVSYSFVTRKGIDYASFTATAGSYEVSYGVDGAPPTVVARSPAPGSTNVSRGTAITATFSEPMDAATITGSRFQLLGPTGTAVAATLGYNAETRTASFAPDSPLAADTTYTATLNSGATDLAGNPISGTISWSFTTEPPLSCPCTVWADSATPANLSASDPNAVELGVKFRSDIDGYITGIRFYKGSGNTGTHIGNLWSANGALLATATFSNETATGWQQVNFDAPVAISANTVYVASYHAPNGGYAFNTNFFSVSGLDKSPLYLLSDAEGAGNGVYRYGGSAFPNQSWNAANYWVDPVFSDSAGGPGGDTTPPTVTAFTVPATANTLTVAITTFTASDNVGVTGYLVTESATAPAAVASGWTATAPASYAFASAGSKTLYAWAKDAAGNVSAIQSAAVTITLTDTTLPTVNAFTVPATSSTLTVAITTFTASDNVGVTGYLVTESATAPAAGASGWTASPPSSYTFASAGSKTLYAWAKDAAGNVSANRSATTTVAAGSGVCATPCSLWDGAATPTLLADPDTSPIELGVKFRSSVDGFITGLRFFKSAQNTGTHVGKLWNSGGTLLAQATFANETASGWQDVSFPSPVAITANTVYVASYHAPVGRYSVNDGYFTTSAHANGPLTALANSESANGVYQYGAGGFPSSTYQSSNYWVDVVMVTSLGPDTTPPQVSSTVPVAGAANVLTGADVKAVFNESMDPGTFGGTTVELRGPGSALVGATVTYEVSTRTATLRPNASLALNTQYTASVKGGVNGVKDLAGNALAADVTWTFRTAVTDPCATGNAIVRENCLPGDSASQWDVSGAGDTSIQGFATDISVDRGEIVDFKIDTPATAYRLDIYRMGYYGGNGARKVATVLPSATLPQTQPACLSDNNPNNPDRTGLVDCGNWGVSASWSVPASAASGIYFAKAIREDGANAGKASHIVFIVRDDDGTSDVLFQTSDTTWHAYNTWGGNSLYTGSGPGTGGGADGRAYKVSYNRPFNTRSVDGGQDWLFYAEYPMVRWLEANGYDVSYFTGVDSDRYGSLIRNHKLFLSTGHDEYWSGQHRANVEAARDAGVHLAFFSGNEVFWKTRWENSISGSGVPYRTLVCYKETHNYPNNPDPADPDWTGTWRDPRNSPPSDGGRPENALPGTIFTVNDGATTQIRVPAADGKMRLWRNTSIANLAAGATATLARGTLGYEWDEDLDNGFRPAGLVRMSTTTVAGAPVLTDFGSSFGSGTATHHLTLYRASSGALVFGAGTVQWSWGLDSTHDDARDLGGDPADVRMQQATVNLFADMSVQPGTLQAGLDPATASTDTTAPTSTISAPTAGTNLPVGTPVTVTGTATDAGGGVVGGVEVSVDGGTTWHPANGRASWSYTWTPMAAATVTIRARAVDDSANLGAASPGVGVTIVTGGDTTPPTVTAFAVPATASTLSVPITTFAATDNVGVTGYLVNESATAPSAGATGWTASAPTSYTFASAGSKTLYAWAKDAAGNVSASRSAPVTITLADTNPPTVTAFTVPGTSSTLSVPITTFTATDNVGVTGYLVNESATPPSSTATGWTATVPTSYTFASPGSKTLYAWAKDAAGNVSASRSAPVTITLSDATAPTVTAFTVPATASTLSVPITTFTATDNVAVTGYLVNESAATPSASASGWSATAPTSYTVASAGSKTLYAWAKDAAGNVSSSLSATVNVSGSLLTTGFLAPTANAAVTSSAGDNNGFQTTPANAYTADGLVAADANSGTNTSTGCTNTGKDKHVFSNLNFSVPNGAAIRGIEVRLRARADSTSGTPGMCVQFSWNGGASWTAAQQTTTLGTALADRTLGSASNTWNRTWAAADFSNTNFRVRVINKASNMARDFYLDAIAVQVTYQ